MRRGEEELLVIRDPLELCEPFAIDAAYADVLDALDGQRTVAQVRQSLMMRGLARVDGEDLEAFVDELGELGLLDDDRFRERWMAAHHAFVEEEIRAPRRAGLLYPDDPDELRAWLAPVLPPARAGSAPPPAAEDRGPGYDADPRPPLALIAPHQPPPAAPELYRRLLAALPGPEAYDRVVILATDHSPGLLPYAACDKDWATPLGTVAADLPSLATLDERVPWLLREQVRLRLSDPIEWTTLLLRALWGDRCPPVLALACGQTRLTTAEGRAQADELIAALTALLGDDERVLWWTSAELSHLGPAFGHPELPERDAVESADRDALAPLLDGRPAQLTRRCMDRPPAERPSGTAALTTLAELLPLSYRAQLLAYEPLPAPGQEPGWIGCAAMTLYPP